MIADLGPYPEYKESGLPWLGRVPSTWRVVRNGSLFGQRNQTGHEALPILEVSLKTGVRVRDFENSTRKQVMSDLGKYKRTAKNDVAYNMMRMWQGAVGVSPVDGLVSPAYVVARPYPHVEPRFFVALFRTGDYMSEIDSCSHGIVKDRNRLYWDRFKQILSPCPPPAEQAAIVRFLDWANGRLERAIRAKRKVIALLHEQKQAIIHRAVTRGLDPSVPLKPSGIPWLGAIPQHWEVRPLKAVCEIQSGITLGKDYVGQTTEEYPYLRVANVQAGHANLAVVKTIRVTRTEAQRCMLQRGDVLMTEGGDPDKLGRGCVWDSQVTPCLHQNHVFAVRPNRSKLEPHFLSALMGTTYARAYFQSTAKQTTNLASTNKTKIGQFEVLLPKVDEQQRILTALHDETRPVHTAISRLEREIELLREYRTRLIADMVTGKLDVRRAAARLPDEAPPDIAADETELSLDAEAAEEEAVV
jgi:type I restriction enzyme S subunit